MLHAKNIKRSFTNGADTIEVLSQLDFKMGDAEVIGIYGASGSGKSTLLHILGGMDKPDAGSVHFEGQDIYSMNESKIADFRNRKIGFVFQFYHLLPEFTSMENVMLPCLISGMKRKEAKEAAIASLSDVGLSHRMSHKPSELSGGEQQRTALARAVVMRPKLILADEPTGNLDRITGEKVFDYLVKLNRDHNIALLVVSHNRELLKALPKTFLLKDGRLVNANGD